MFLTVSSANEKKEGERESKGEKHARKKKNTEISNECLS